MPYFYGETYVDKKEARSGVVFQANIFMLYNRGKKEVNCYRL
jgi:hypothetical protein